MKPNEVVLNMQKALVHGNRPGLHLGPMIISRRKLRGGDFHTMHEYHNVDFQIENWEQCDLDRVINEHGLHDGTKKQIKANEKMLKYLLNETTGGGEGWPWPAKKTLHEKWRRYFGKLSEDSVEVPQYLTTDRIWVGLWDTVRKLQEDASTRQAYIAIWDNTEDILSDSGPSLLGLHVQITGAVLEMTVFDRSMDLAFLANDMYYFAKLADFFAERLSCTGKIVNFHVCNMHMFKEIKDDNS